MSVILFVFQRPEIGSLFVMCFECGRKNVDEISDRYTHCTKNDEGWLS